MRITEAQIKAGDVKALLQELGKTQRETAAELGVNVTSVERWCSPSRPTRPHKRIRRTLAAWINRARAVTA